MKKSLIKKLQEKLSTVPDKPGVYLHKNQKNEILYIGKAKNLKNRLKSYFISQTMHSHKTRALVDKVHDFDFILTLTEYESLVLENNLIKHHKPHYNFLLKDDKTYPYLKINLKDKWPQVVLTRRKKDDGALYFGPYTNGYYLHKFLSFIHRFFPLVKCTKETFKRAPRPCNYYHIQKCMAPCHLDVNREEYREMVNRVVSLLKGHTRDIISKLKLDMKKAVEKLNFERAANIRDFIKSLEMLSHVQTVSVDFPLNLDIVSFILENNYLVFYVSHIREGKLTNANSYVIPQEENDNLQTQEDIFTSCILQFYDNQEIPENILCLDEHEQLSSNTTQNILKFLQEKTEHVVQLFTHEKILYKSASIKKKFQKNVEGLIQLSRENAKNKLESKLKHTATRTAQLKEIQKLLELKNIPNIIECYDISTFQGAETVGSRAVFKEGKPYKALYRKYKIKFQPGKLDDFASLREVLSRRFKEGNDHNVDLLVIDGGTPQLRVAIELFKNLNLEHIQFVGLAKARTLANFEAREITSLQERLVIPKRDAKQNLILNAEPDVKILDPHSKSFQLLTALRDEAHRFAITYHRKLRDKKTLSRHS